MIKGPGISLNQVAITLNRVELLKPIDLSLEAGGWHGIVGRNGGGKSTLLKAVAGLLPHHGEIALHWNIHQDGKPKRGRVGYMPQLAPFDASLPVSVLDYLRLNSQKRPVWRRYRRDPWLTEVIDQVEINGLLCKRVGTLSMGERQRVLLAVALLQKPGVLLLDEPLAGIDKAGQSQMLTLLSEFHKQGGTLLMIEHNWQVLKQHCDTVTLIDGGLQASGAPKAIFAQLTDELAAAELPMAQGI